MERVLQSTAPTIYGRFYLDGVGTNPTPDTATVEITRADGTVLVASTPATNVAGAGNDGKFSFQLTTTHTALLDRLTVRWTSNLGTVVTTVEVAGGFLFSIAQALADSALAGLTAADIAARRTVAEYQLEQACGVAFVPRYERERLAGRSSWLTDNLQLKWPKLRAIRDATVAGAALSAGQLATVVPTGSLFYYPSGWATSGAAYDITVGYEHGYDFPPGGADSVALALAKRGPVDPNATGAIVRAQAGEESFTYASPSGATFGIQEVDKFVEQHRFLTVV